MVGGLDAENVDGGCFIVHFSHQLELSCFGINPKYAWVLRAGPPSGDGVHGAALGEVFVRGLHLSNPGSGWKNKVPEISSARRVQGGSRSRHSLCEGRKALEGPFTVQTLMFYIFRSIKFRLC